MRYDPLLTHYLAAELDARLAGATARSLRVDAATRSAALETAAGTLVLDLRPSHGLITLAAPPAAGLVLPLHRRSVVSGIHAPPDERLLVIEMRGGSRSRVGRVVVELMTNQWNVLALNGPGRILGVAWARDAGERRLRPGAAYTPPPEAGRVGVEAPVDRAAWHARLDEVSPADRSTAVVRTLAWTSALNVNAILGDAARSAAAEALDAAYDRYAALASRPAPAPRVARVGGAAQPYPLPLPGIPSEPVPTLLGAVAAALNAPAPLVSGAAGVGAESAERLRRRVGVLEARLARLSAQGSGARAEADALRQRADVLLANLNMVRKGVTRTRLSDFAGGEVELELDPALTPAENAARLYEEARRRARAAARVPGLLASAQAELARLVELAGRVERGEATVGEVEAAVPGPASGPVRHAEDRLPYRAYRSSGGLELRVGRTRRDNDELTFHHSSPEDVWLHARDAAGAHVILRWGDASSNPPQRDLAEAAMLAALHSRARSSGVAAVDWTRRKYVRKPRKAPPGLVVPERVRTLFVEPDPGVERRLRVGGEPAAG